MICKKLLEEFNEKNPRKIYGYLQNFGMYRPDRTSYQAYKNLQKTGFWEKTERIYHKYKQKWQGPEIPIYIFPFNDRNRDPVRQRDSKSGVSFNDRLFLFISHLEDDTELEAVFVHEYHHVCRMNRQKKHVDDYTLLDSIVLEGLAEHAVLETCGEEYSASWCHVYNEKQLDYFWKKFISENLAVKRNDKIHDQLLFGLGRYPKMLGYAAGFDIISKYKKTKNISERTSFVAPAEIFINAK